MPTYGSINVGVAKLQKAIITPLNQNYGHLITHNPLDLVCLDFTQVDPSKWGKENVLVMTDAFTKFSVAVTTNNQQALTVAKALVERWFHVYGIPSCIHSDQGKSFDNKIVDALCKMYGVERNHDFNHTIREETRSAKGSIAQCSAY